MLNKTLNTYNKSSKFYEENQVGEFPVVAQWKGTQPVSMRLQVLSLASLSGLRILHCPEVWCRIQMPLGSALAVAVV